MTDLLRMAKRRWHKAAVKRSYGPFSEYITASEKITGWARGPEAIELARVANSLPTDALVVEIGSFLGSSAVLLAGGRKLAGSGLVHCVDPFDGSGDAHSTPVYSDVIDSLARPIRDQFEQNVRAAGVYEYVVVHEGTAEDVGATWRDPIDMLFLDGDQSPAGAKSAYESWIPFLKPGGVVAVHNSAERLYSPEHDGHRRVVLESIVPPEYAEIRTIATTTFALRVS